MFNTSANIRCLWKMTLISDLASKEGVTLFSANAECLSYKGLLSFLSFAYEKCWKDRQCFHAANDDLREAHVRITVGLSPFSSIDLLLFYR